MSFKERIEAKENIFLSSLDTCKKSGLRTYIYGNGIGAKNLRARTGYTFDGYLVDKKYYFEKMGENIFCLEDFFENTNEIINLIIGFESFDFSHIEKYRDKINMLVYCDCIGLNIALGTDFMSYSFVEENEDKLEEIYSSLSDEKSKLSLIAYINQKISADFKYLAPIYEENQYFPEDIITLNNNEVFVDCGAYNGDTAEEFIDNIKRHNVSYKKIISFEPDPVNFRALKAKGFNNHECINMGTSDCKSTIRFWVDGYKSCISVNGNMEVEVNTIDNMIKDDVTFIKMDIEGMELASLKGAEQIIKRCKPKLAICIYHKFEDLWEIQNYISSIVSEYKFYIRAHAKMATEVVLYAIV